MDLFLLRGREHQINQDLIRILGIVPGSLHRLRRAAVEPDVVEHDVIELDVIEFDVRDTFVHATWMRANLS